MSDLNSTPLAPPAQKTVLFLCTGNYYRSRFAEILFNWLAPQQELGWIADSRGLQLDPQNEGPLSRHTRARLKLLGIPLADPIRYPITVGAADFQSATHVVAVKEIEHRPMIQRWFPEWLDRVEFWQVHDVDCAEPEVALPELHQHVVSLISRLSER